MSKFLLIYTRIVIGMCITFMALHMQTDIANLTQTFKIQILVIVVLTPFIYLPIPSWFYNRLRHSYQLIVRNEGGEADDEPVDDRP